MAHTAAALIAGPDRALSWIDRHTRAIYRALLGSGVAAVLLWHAHALAGTAGLVVFGAAVAAIWAAVVGYRAAPQVTGTIASTIAATSLVMITATAMNPLWMLIGVDELALVYPAVFLAVAACAWLMPSTGVHRGWTAAVGHAVMLASLPLAVWSTGTSWRGVVVLTGMVAALTAVGLRIRKVPVEARPRGWKRALRISAIGIVVTLMGLSMALVNPGTANANPFARAVGGIVDDATCSMATPNLSNEPIGTGPENLISNINFGGAEQPNLPAGQQQPPQYADVATNFTKASNHQNYSLEDYTLYEIAGLRGLKWVNWQKSNTGETMCSFPQWVSVMTGNMLFKVTTYGLQITLAFKEWSQVSNPLEMLYDKANPLIGDIFSMFFLPMAGVMFMVAGIAIGLRAVRGPEGLRQGLADVGFSLVVCALAGFVYMGVATASWQNPNGNGFYMTAEILDTTAGGLNNAFAEAVFAMVDTNEVSMCQRPTSSGADIAPSAPGQRITSCILAESLAYKPWAIGQFGLAGANPIPTSTEVTRFSDPRVDADPAMEQGSGGTEEAGLPCYNNIPDANGFACGDMRSYLIAQAGGPSVAARMQACLDDGGVDTGDDEIDYEVLARCEPYHAVAADLYYQAENGGGMYPSEASDIIAAYRGQGSYPHVAQAFSSIIGVIVTGIGLGSMGVITLMWHAWLWCLFVMGLFQLLWAVYPGKSKVAKEWVTNVMSTFAQRVLYGFAMTLMIWVIAIVFAMQINTGLKILWCILVLVATWMMIQKIQNAAADKAPNMARYGRMVGAAPAAMAGYGAYKGLSKAGGAAVGGASSAAGSAARGTARAARVGTVGAARGGGKAARWTGTKVGQGARNVSEPFVDKATAKTEAARTRKDAGTATVGDKLRVAGAATVSGAREAGSVGGYYAKRTGHGVTKISGTALDAANMSAREQLRGTQGPRSAAFDANRPNRDVEKTAEQARRDGRKEARQQIRADRADRQKLRDQLKQSRDFGLGGPINRPPGGEQ